MSETGRERGRCMMGVHYNFLINSMLYYNPQWKSLPFKEILKSYMNQGEGFLNSTILEIHHWFMKPGDGLIFVDASWEDRVSPNTNYDEKWEFQTRP